MNNDEGLNRINENRTLLDRLWKRNGNYIGYVIEVKRNINACSSELIGRRKEKRKKVTNDDKQH